jgi:hypothetical protein
LIGKSPLPPGCRFYIWPRYRLEIGERAARLSPSQAEVLLLLMSAPGRLFSAREIAETLYVERDDGGPEFARNHVRKQVCDLLGRCRDAGIDLRLKNPLTSHGYAFMGVGVMESPKAALARMGVRLPAGPPAIRPARYRAPLEMRR